jgi:hypothetical protein
MTTTTEEQRAESASIDNPEFMRLMKAWDCASAGSPRAKAFRAICNYINSYVSRRSPPPAAEGVEGWICLNDRKPKDFEVVIVALTSGAVTTGQRGPAGWHWLDTDDAADEDGIATHWMPLPPPPAITKAGKKGEENG